MPALPTRWRLPAVHHEPIAAKQQHAGRQERGVERLDVRRRLGPERERVARDQAAGQTVVVVRCGQCKEPQRSQPECQRQGEERPRGRRRGPSIARQCLVEGYRGARAPSSAHYPERTAVGPAGLTGPRPAPATSRLNPSVTGSILQRVPVVAGIAFMNTCGACRPPSRQRCRSSRRTAISGTPLP